MFARVVRFEVSPERAEGAIEFSKRRALPTASSTPGFRGGYWLFDRAAGKAAVVTLWATQGAMDASVQMSAAWREESAQALGTDPLSVEEYEVVANT